MKISKKTLEVLANFATINPGIVINPGNEIKTISIVKRGFAQAKIEETIPTKVAIYALPELLNVIGLFSDPDIEFHDKHLVISEGKNNIKYFYSSDTIIAQSPQGKNIELPNVDLTFTLSKHALTQINKTASIMKFDVIGVSKNGLRVFLSKTANSTTNVYNMGDVNVSTELPESEELRFNIEDLKLIPGDYHIEVSAKGLGKFTNVADPNLVYFIPLVVQEKK